MALTSKQRRMIRWLWHQTNDSCQEVEDGGAGSGNWGHKGRPGSRGGSGAGGGKKYRSGNKEEGFTQKKLDDPVEASNKYKNSGSSKFSRGSGAKFTPKSKEKYDVSKGTDRINEAFHSIKMGWGGDQAAAITQVTSEVDKMPTGTRTYVTRGVANGFTIEKGPDGNWFRLDGKQYAQDLNSKNVAYLLGNGLFELQSPQDHEKPFQLELQDKEMRERSEKTLRESSTKREKQLEKQRKAATTRRENMIKKIMQMNPELSREQAEYRMDNPNWYREQSEEELPF